MERDLKCMYCAEAGITNTDVFIEIVDEELGLGWICKECFLESEKEKDEHLKELEEQLKRKEQECEELKAKIEYVFSDASPNFDYFCDICVAKDSCNQNCCFEQIKELIYEVE